MSDVQWDFLTCHIHHLSAGFITHMNSEEFPRVLLNYMRHIHVSLKITIWLTIQAQPHRFRRQSDPPSCFSVVHELVHWLIKFQMANHSSSTTLIRKRTCVQVCIWDSILYELLEHIFKEPAD